MDRTGDEIYLSILNLLSLSGTEGNCGKSQQAVTTKLST